MDKQALKNNVTNGNQWTRILYMLLFGVILYLVMMVLCVVVIVQVIFALISGSPNDDIRRFSSDLLRYLRQVVMFLTYNRDAKPYPFQSWQSDEADDEIIEAEYEEPVSESDVKPHIPE